MSRDDEKREATPAGTGAAKLSTSIGIIAAMVIAVVANVFVARHYKRWDVTRGGLYTLSDPTLQTLHVGHKEVITNQLAFGADGIGQLFPAIPVLFSQSIFDTDDGIISG